MNYETEYNKMTESVENFTEAMAKEIDTQNLNYLLKDKALDMGFCPKINGYAFETIFVEDDDVFVQFKNIKEETFYDQLTVLSPITILQIGLVCKRVLESIKEWKVFFMAEKHNISGSIIVKGSNANAATLEAERKLMAIFDHDFYIHTIEEIKE